MMGQMNPQMMQMMQQQMGGGNAMANPMMAMMKNMMPNQPSGPASNMAPPPPGGSRFSSEPPGPRPLFAAGQAQPPPGGPPGSGPVRGAVGQPVGKIVSSSANSRIVHPEDDVSLEELKAKKYKHLADRTGTVQFSMGLSSNNQRDNNKDRENEGYDNG